MDGPEALASSGIPVDGTTGPFALVLLGGGARAAYQVGFLRGLIRQMPDVRFPILTGVSSGAINVAHLASRCREFAEAVEELRHLWLGLTPDRVMRTGTLPLFLNVFLWGLRLVSGGSRLAPTVRGLVDSGPLRELLTEFLEAKGSLGGGIDESVQSGRLASVALSATSYDTGEHLTWFQGCDVPAAWERPGRRGRRAELTVDHVMASAALPLLFPAVGFDGLWYGDGGVGMAAPLSPAIHLGADRVLAISSHRQQPRPSIRHVEYPPPAKILSALVNTVFADSLLEDARRLDRVNSLLAEIDGGSRTGLRPVRLCEVRPSADLGALASEYEARLPWALRFMTRGWGTQETRDLDVLSLLMFQPDYLRRLIELGEEDAEALAGELEAFFYGE